MASLMSRLRQAFARPPEAKRSATGPLIALHGAHQPVWMSRDPASFAREGFAGNPVGYRCVRMIAEAAASVPWLAYAGADEAPPGHAALALIERPNPAMTGRDWREAFFGHLLVSGNAYAEAVLLDGTLRELHVLRPDRMRLVPGNSGWPEAFDYTVNGTTHRFHQNQAPLPDPILHVKLFDPLADHYGLSPFAAAARAVDIHNAASTWTKALLDNAARPSGALIYRGEGNLTEEQFTRLRSELETTFQGAANAGRPLVLEGGLEWTEMSLSPRDMDHAEARNAAARDIALAFGVPPMLLGIPGDNTYANYAEANRAFWRQSVLPLLARLTDAMTHWLAPAWPELALRFAFDADAVDALAAERQALWSRIGDAAFLTTDEKRAATGYGPLGGEP